MRSDCILTDLESLTGKIVQGDITPIVYNLIKDSAHIDLFEQSCLEYLSDKEKKEIKENVHKQNSNTNTCEDFSRRPSIEEWLSEFGELIAVSRKVR